MKTKSVQSRAIAGLSTLALAVGLAAPGFCEPGAGAFGPSPTTTKGRAPLRASQAAEPSATSNSSKPFFKTTKGVVSVVLMAGMVGWLVQSRSSNKVVSPGSK